MKDLTPSDPGKWNPVLYSTRPTFMEVENAANEKMLWYIIIHITLVTSAFIMGYLDKISKHR